MVHRGTRAAQSTQQTIGKHLVIFGYQNAHGCLLLLWAFDPPLWLREQNRF
jgi:hypothetical protein